MVLGNFWNNVRDDRESQFYSCVKTSRSWRSGTLEKKIESRRGEMDNLVQFNYIGIILPKLSTAHMACSSCITSLHLDFSHFISRVFAHLEQHFLVGSQLNFTQHLKILIVTGKYDVPTWNWYCNLSTWRVLEGSNWPERPRVSQPWIEISLPNYCPSCS